LNWSAATDDTGVTAYNVYRCSENDDHFTKIGTVATQTYLDNNLLYATGYQYYVTAADAAMNRSRSSDTVVISTGTRPAGSGSNDPGPDVPQDEQMQEELPPGAGSFLDISHHWARDPIIKLSSQGIVSGYPDNSFKPDRSITRAEFVAILAKALEYDLKAGQYFSDTEGHWARDYIAAARSRNIVHGYSENEFRPDAFITREEMVAMIAMALGLSSDQTESVFVDEADISQWARAYVATAYRQKIIQGYPDGSLKPHFHSSRAEAVSIILRALDL
ncbi:MAG TPA: S-layer homology domain-containing protein, partial [Bacillota bacterium]|nr:S-layer homology domain-containing protein [Bacillota bacterium]